MGVLLTTGTSARHGDRVSKSHRESIGLDFRQVKEDWRKRERTERRSSFTFVRSKCIGEASKRILPVLKAAVEFEIKFLGYVLFTDSDSRHTQRKCTTKNNETDHERYSRVCIKALRRIKLHHYNGGHDNPNI